MNIIVRLKCLAVVTHLNRCSAVSAFTLTAWIWDDLDIAFSSLYLWGWNIIYSK